MRNQKSKIKNQKLISGIKQNVSLKKHTTFKIGGPAKYFFVAKNREDIINAVKKTKGAKLPFFVLGAGSNVLAPDEGFSGLIIRIKNLKLKIKNFEIYAEAGTRLEDLVDLSAKESLTGLEWAAGIPGTVGGSIYGNAQAFDTKISDIVKSVEIFNTKNLSVKNFSKKQCQFFTKNSIFKKNKKLIILSVILKLKKGKKKEIQKKIKENLDWREQRHPLNFPSAGSIFINQKSKIKNQKLLKKFPKLEEFNKLGMIPSAYLIEQSGLSGKKVGNAQVSEKHAGFIVNTGKAKARDVLKLIKIIKQKVKNKFGINLKEEIQIIK